MKTIRRIIVVVALAMLASFAVAQFTCNLTYLAALEARAAELTEESRERGEALADQSEAVNDLQHDVLMAQRGVRSARANLHARQAAQAGAALTLASCYEARTRALCGAALATYAATKIAVDDARDALEHARYVLDRAERRLESAADRFDTAYNAYVRWLNDTVEPARERAWRYRRTC